MAQKHAATGTAAEAGLAKALSTGTVLCLEGIEPKSLLPGKTNKQTSPNPSDICLFPRKKINVEKKKKKSQTLPVPPCPFGGSCSGDDLSLENQRAFPGSGTVTRPTELAHEGHPPQRGPCIPWRCQAGIPHGFIQPPCMPTLPLPIRCWPDGKRPRF